MATNYIYQQQIDNSYLGVIKVIKAQTRWELDLKIQEQQRKWSEQENRGRERDRVADMKIQAEYMTKEAQREHELYKQILSSTLLVNDALNWNNLMQNDTFPPFNFAHTPPQLEHFYQRYNIPKKSCFEKIFKSKREKRLSIEANAKSEYDSVLWSYNTDRDNALREYEAQKLSFETAKNEYNASIMKWKEQFESGDALSIEKYTGVVLANSHYPYGISAESKVFYDTISKTAVVSFTLPSPEDIADIIGYKFVVSRKTIDPIKLKQKEKTALYENVIHQISLRTIHELFEGIYIPELLETVVFNGWVNGINKATGKDFHACILSVQATRQEFQKIDLSRVDPKECLWGLKALSAGPLSNLAPVNPIMDMNREDKRFVASEDVLDAMKTDTNLASMPWEEFEHLVRELFGKVFSRDGAEVRVTQASRDGGVDAIAFDPDPIRGGKFVIQAKRYNIVVPVSACRDLYGTMINEGAVKGILVTTSYFGKDSRDFVKDKPITLIDGANLVHMLGEYGYNFRIELKE